jgi:hypothetical protein
MVFSFPEGREDSGRVPEVPNWLSDVGAERYVPAAINWLVKLRRLYLRENEPGR